MLPQDLHIHTTWSSQDGAVVPEQTIDLVASVAHADIVGISDHFEHIGVARFGDYARAVRTAGLRLGTEVNGAAWVDDALSVDVDYYVYHCYDRDADYAGAQRLADSKKPLIIAHPNAMGTDLNRIPDEAYAEINNRYIWRNDWRAYFGPHVHRCRFVISSDAHQPNWLGQSVARSAARELGVRESLLF